MTEIKLLNKIGKARRRPLRRREVHPLRGRGGARRASSSARPRCTRWRSAPSCWPSRARARASTTSRLTVAASRASSCSTPRAPTPTASRNWRWPRCCFPPGKSTPASLGQKRSRGRRASKSSSKRQKRLRRPRAARQDAGRHRLGRHRRPRRQRRRRAGDAGGRLRPVHHRQRRMESVARRPQGG